MKVLISRTDNKGRKGGGENYGEREKAEGERGAINQSS